MTESVRLLAALKAENKLELIIVILMPLESNLCITKVIHSFGVLAEPFSCGAGLAPSTICGFVKFIYF